MNAFASFHPAVLAFYFASVLLAAMFFAHPLLSLLTLAGGALFCMCYTTPAQKKSDLGFYLPLFVLIAITNPLFSHNGATPLFFMNGNAVTREAILYGAGAAAMMIAALLWCKAMGFVFTSDRLAYLLGCGAPRLALAFTMALRFVPMLKRRARQIGRVQKAMGLYASESYADRVRAALRVFSALIGSSLEHAVETGRAMTARGYGSGKKRTSFHDFRFRGGDAVLLAVSAAALIVLFACGAAHQLDFVYYPRIRYASSAGTVMGAAADAVLAFLPFCVEAAARLRWRRDRAKIGAAPRSGRAPSR